MEVELPTDFFEAGLRGDELRAACGIAAEKDSRDKVDESQALLPAQEALVSAPVVEAAPAATFDVEERRGSNRSR